jgi:resuscitation-promoting factor RpfB
VLEFLQRRAARVTATAVVLGGVAGGAAAYVHSGKTVTLTVDGASRTVDADADTVQALLADEQVPVTSRDIVAPGLTAPLKDGQQVVVRYARPLTVTVDGLKRTYWTTALTVDDALNVLSIRADGARLSASRSMPLGRQGLVLAISTPKTVTLTADGRSRAVTTTAQTVAQLLAEQGVAVDGDDKLSVGAGDAVVNKLAVTVTRISHRRTALVETVPFGTVRTTSSRLYAGQTKVVTQGKPGSRRAVYDVVRTDGKKTAQTFVSATLVSAPVDQVVEVGTKPKPKPATPTTTSGSGKGSGSGGGGGSVGGGVDGLNWPALAKCESGGNPRAVNPAGYYGLYQFSLATWHRVGGSGNPIDASPAEQLYRAKLLYKSGGAGQWGCGRHLFD